jgi:hypothetical protein
MRKGYVHWAIPLLVLTFLFGYIIASFMHSKLMAAFGLVLLGGVSGHMLLQRKKASVFSAFLLIVGLFSGYLLADTMLSDPLVAFIFFTSLLVAYSAEKALLK